MPKSVLSFANVVSITAESHLHCRLVQAKYYAAAQVKRKAPYLSNLMDLVMQTKGIGGAGAALLEVQPQGLALIRWRAVALPKCPDNIYAEAMSADIGTDLLCDELNDDGMQPRKYIYKVTSSQL